MHEGKDDIEVLLCPKCEYNVVVQVRHGILKCPGCGTFLPNVTYEPTSTLRSRWESATRTKDCSKEANVALSTAVAGVLLYLGAELSRSAVALDAYWAACYLALAIEVFALGMALYVILTDTCNMDDPWFKGLAYGSLGISLASIVYSASMYMVVKFSGV